MMAKYGRSWGKMIADPLHVKSHADEFHADLTPEEKENWDREMGGKSLLAVFMDYRKQMKTEKQRAKEAVRESKKKDMKPEEHEYFKGILGKLKKTDEALVAAEGEDNESEGL